MSYADGDLRRQRDDDAFNWCCASSDEWFVATACRGCPPSLAQLVRSFRLPITDQVKQSSAQLLGLSKFPLLRRSSNRVQKQFSVSYSKVSFYLSVNSRLLLSLFVAHLLCMHDIGMSGMTHCPSVRLSVGLTHGGIQSQSRCFRHPLANEIHFWDQILYPRYHCDNFKQDLGGLKRR